MLCRNKPDNAQMYYHIMDKDMVKFLIERGCHPLYMVGHTYYFIRNDLTQMWLAEYNKSSRKEVGDDAI